MNHVELKAAGNLFYSSHKEEILECHTGTGFSKLNYATIVNLELKWSKYLILLSAIDNISACKVIFVVWKRRKAYSTMPRLDLSKTFITLQFSNLRNI